MVILPSAVVPNCLPFACIAAAKLKPVKPEAVFRLRKNESNGLSRRTFQMEFQSHDDMEMHQDKLRSLTSQPENSHNDIWRLFKEAQQKELEEMKKEEKSLLDRIEQLEVKMQAKTGKGRVSTLSTFVLKWLQLPLKDLWQHMLQDYPMHYKERETWWRYSSLNLDDVQGLREIDTEVFSYFNGQMHGNRIWTGVVRGIGVTFIQPLYYSFFSREKIHGYSDDFERFTYFSRASLDYLVKSGKQPDVIHIHNWETSIVGPRFWDVFVNQGLGGTRILLTCQGFDSQCLEQPDKLALCGLDPSSLHRPDRLQDNNKAQLVNILKGGVVYSNKVILVTSTHLEGPLFRSSNNGLEPTLAIHKDKLLIVPSGVDNSMGDPSGNILPVQSYSSDEINNNPSKWNRTRMDATKKVSPWDEQHYDLHVSAYLSVANL